MGRLVLCGKALFQLCARDKFPSNQDFSEAQRLPILILTEQFKGLLCVGEILVTGELSTRMTSSLAISGIGRIMGRPSWAARA